MRLIDADALKKDDEITEWITRDAIRTGKMLKAFSELFVKKIDAAPTIQAVPIDVLDKIIAEIDAHRKTIVNMADIDDWYAGKLHGHDCDIEIIDKYRVESE